MLKLLDYGKPNPFGEIIGRPRNLAWPVNVYRVTLPRAADDGDGLNPFERVILKFLDAVGVMDACALADETRIPLDLVKSILLRFQDKALIDEYNTIVEQEYDNSEGEKAPVFVTALLFRELATGKILPFLRWLDDANPLRKTEGDEKSFRSIRWDDAHKKNPPVQRDVINALRAMKRRSAAFGRDEKMPAIQQITIARSPELYHLYCPIAIQKSDGEFRIADPFGNGFSLILERAFEQLLEQDEQLADWLYRWKLSLSNPRSQKQDAKPKEPFENDSNRKRYPKLVANLRPSQNEQFRSIAKIHASIEWALFYACCRHSFENVITKLKFTGQLEHSALLGNVAKSVGLEPPEFDFRSIREGKLLDFQNGKAEFGTVLAIAILQAESNESHPLRRIASMYPDLISRLLGIKKKRDKKGHGKGDADAPKRELSDDPFMREIVHTLLPDIVFSDTPATELNKDIRADSLLDARASIQSEFSFKVFNRLGANLQDRLVQAERFWLSCKDNDDALFFVCDLYAALQANFRQRLSGKLPPDIMDFDLITTAQRKARESSLGDLPKCLRTVRPLAIRATLQGNDPTLGACVVAFLLMSDDDTLHSIQSSQPSFIDDITNVIVKRGHGNEPLPLPKAYIAKLRKASYKTIKTLIEV
jgi:hypothetical protein